MEIVGCHVSRVNTKMSRRLLNDVLYTRRIKHILFVTHEDVLNKIFRGSLEDVH